MQSVCQRNEKGISSWGRGGQRRAQEGKTGKEVLIVKSLKKEKKRMVSMKSPSNPFISNDEMDILADTVITYLDRTGKLQDVLSLNRGENGDFLVVIGDEDWYGRAIS
jgi:hypothetical protein